MPRINKHRIVGLPYDGGRTQYTDVVFDYKLLNTIINMENGVGKTVLVQLFLQTISPNVSVGDRKMKQYLSKPGSHTFLVQEWRKDGSSDYFLLGIAMRGRRPSSDAAAAGDDAEEQGSKDVEYYMFYSEYSDPRSPCAVSMLPLSHNEDNTFVVERYDFMKTYARQHRAIKIVDRKGDWEEIVRQFGISQSEVMTLIGINQKESGITPFFAEKSKTVAQLLQNCLLPAVERSVLKDNERTVEQNFIGLGESFYRNERNMRLSRDYEHFLDMSQGLQADAEKLRIGAVNVEKSVADCYACIAKLEHYGEQFQNAKNECAEEIKGLDAEHNYIRHEEASCAFHNANINHISAEGAFTEAANAKELAESAYDASERELRILNAADAYKKLCAEKDSLDRTLIEIDMKSKETERSKLLNDLTYSINRKAAAERTVLADEIDKANSIQTGAQQAVSEISAQLADAEKKRNEHESNFSRLSGELTSLAEINDGYAVKASGQLLQRKLDGSYNSREIKAAENEISDRRQNAVIDKDEQTGIRDDCIRRISEIPHERKAAVLDIERCNQEIENSKAALSEYRTLRDNVALYGASIGVSVLSGKKASYLDSIDRDLAENDTKRARINRLRNVLEDEVSAAMRGTLHVPASAISHLDKLDVQYETCEARLLKMVEDGMMTKDDVESLLAEFPILAYSILIFSDSDLDVLKDGSGDWVGAAVPVLLQSDFAKVLDGSFAWNENMITCYEASYFSDPGNFISVIHEKLNKLSERLDENLVEKARLTDIKNDIDAFFVYSETYEDDVYAHIADEENNVTMLRMAITDLDAEKSRCEEGRAAADEAILKADEFIRKAEAQDRFIKELKAGLKREAELKASCKELGEKIATITASIPALKRDLSSQNEIVDYQTSMLTELNLKLKEADEYIAGSSVYSLPADVIELAVVELVRQKKAIEAGISHDMEILLQRKEEAENRVRMAKESLLKHSDDLSPEEYEGAFYSLDVYHSAVARNRELKKALDNAVEEKSRANAVLMVANNELENAERSLAEWKGIALPESEIGKDFEKRLTENRRRKTKADQALSRYENLITRVEMYSDKIRELISDTPKNPDFSSVLKIGNFKNDAKDVVDTLKRTMSQRRMAFEDAVKSNEKSLRNLMRTFENSENLGRLLEGLEKAMPDRAARIFEVDVYVKLVEKARERVSENLATCEQQMANILHEKNSVVDACLKLGEQLAEGVDQIAKKTNIKIDEKTRKQILRIRMPKVESEDEARVRIAEMVSEGVNSYVEDKHKLDSGEITQAKMESKYSDLMSSYNLLMRYLGGDNQSIRVDAYKFASPEQDVPGRYVKWRDLHEFSGAQKFVLYLSIMLATIAYARRSYDFENFSEDISFVLIMDNPFAEIQSPNMIAHMFELARRMNTQIIALTNIQNSAVSNACPQRYVVKTAKVPSGVNIITTELHTAMNSLENTVESGFYRTEQIAMPIEQIEPAMQL